MAINEPRTESVDEKVVPTPKIETEILDFTRKMRRFPGARGGSRALGLSKIIAIKTGKIVDRSLEFDEKYFKSSKKKFFKCLVTTQNQTPLILEVTKH